MGLWQRWDLAAGGVGAGPRGGAVGRSLCSAAKQNCAIRTANASLSSKSLAAISVWLWQSRHCQQMGRGGRAGICFNAGLWLCAVSVLSVRSCREGQCLLSQQGN